MRCAGGNWSFGERVCVSNASRQVWRTGMVRIIGIIAALACVASPAFSQATTVDDLPPATVGVKTLTVTLTGEAEVPGPGAAGGRGSAFLVLHPNAGTLCFALKLSNMPVPNAAHIHKGAEGVVSDRRLNSFIETTSGQAFSSRLPVVSSLPQLFWWFGCFRSLPL